MRTPMEYGKASRYWKFWLTLRTSRLIRFSRSSGRELRLLSLASSIFKEVRWEVDIGRNTSLFEFTESFLRLTSSNPIVSGSLLSLLKLAFNSSKHLRQKYII
jgi:hypothetical protein